MKAGHSKLDGCSATLLARRPSPRLSTVLAPFPPPPSLPLCSYTYALLPTAEPPQIPVLFPGIDFLFRRRQPPLGAGAAPSAPALQGYRAGALKMSPFPFRNPLLKIWY
jgi:hypothetical protein